MLIFHAQVCSSLIRVQDSTNRTAAVGKFDPLNASKVLNVYKSVTANPSKVNFPSKRLLLSRYVYEGLTKKVLLEQNGPRERWKRLKDRKLVCSRIQWM